MAIRHRYFTGIPNDTRYEDDSDPSIKSPDDFGWYYPGYHFVCWKNVTNEEEVMPGDLYGGGSFNAIWEKSLVNKVIVGTETLLDLTQDTVSPSTLQLGMTAHDASGKVITGTMDTYTKTEIDDIVFGGLLKRVEIEILGSTSIAAGGYNYDTYTISQSQIGEGWIPVSISGWVVNNRYVSVYNLRLRADNPMEITRGLYNTSSSARATTLTVSLLCIRTS